MHFLQPCAPCLLCLSFGGSHPLRGAPLRMAAASCNSHLHTNNDSVPPDPTLLPHASCTTDNHSPELSHGRGAHRELMAVMHLARTCTP
jgi:hypothetical protein